MTVPTQLTINTPYMVGPVHCYTATLGGDLALFDTGPPTPAGQQFLEQNIDLKNLKHVFITHAHIDHYGQARWLELNSDATVYLPYLDHLKIIGHENRIEQMYHLLCELGFDGDYLKQLRAIFDSGALFPPFPENYKISETEIPEQLGVRVLECPGHSQSDLVYVGKEWLVTGDTLLKGVFQSPVLDVDLQDGGRFKNYRAYCETIVKLAAEEGKAVLPGHKGNIVSIKNTLEFYVSKLLSRVAQLHPYRDETNIMVLVDKLLSGRMTDIFHIYLKASEIMFMKDLLQDPELLETALKRAGLFERLDKLFYSATVGYNHPN
ncbi:MAG: MBL fold metallo-hydrolase [Desulfobulbaceae bacterium]|nr:MBL fold metallo-hydrolase [Desulfobulbaceae bacterium]